MVFPVVGGNQSTGDFVTNSLRFNDDDSPYLVSGTLSSPNTDKFTISMWVKLNGARCQLGALGKRLTGEAGDNYSIDIDQGTTSSGSILFDLKGKKIFSSQYEFRQIFPNLGWVEHNPEDIWTVTFRTIKEAIKKSKYGRKKIHLMTGKKTI